MRKQTGSLEGLELIKSWQEAHARGLNQSQHAQEIGLHVKAYQTRLYTARQMFGKVETSRYPKYDKAFDIFGDALLMGDIHSPLHKSEFINPCVDLAVAWNIPNLILGGDQVDGNAFSHWTRPVEGNDKATISVEAENRLLDLAAKMSPEAGQALRESLAEIGRQAGDIGDELKETRAMLNKLIRSFDTIYTITGNHEDRVTRLLEKTMPVNNLNELFWGESAKIKMSEYYYCTLTSNGVKYRITHPMNSGKGSSKRLVSKFLCNIIMFHNHHMSTQSDPSGRYIAIEPGACADFERVDYLQLRDNPTDTPMNGAVIVRNGHPWVLNKWTDFEALKRAA